MLGLLGKLSLEISIGHLLLRSGRNLLHYLRVGLEVVPHLDVTDLVFILLELVGILHTSYHSLNLALSQSVLHDLLLKPLLVRSKHIVLLDLFEM